MKRMTVDQVRSFFKAMEPDYDVRVPIRLLDGTRTLGTLNEGALAIDGGCLPGKTTSVFFPQLEPMLGIEPGKFEQMRFTGKPLFVVGFTAQDADCLQFIDRFYGENYHDDLYFSKRSQAVVVCVSGGCGPEGEFLRIAGGNCDLELISDGQNYLLNAYTEIGRTLALKAGGDEADETAFQQAMKQSDAMASDDLRLLQKASAVLLEEKVPDEFWMSVSDRCIACTSCNMVCPTCTCFDVFDRKSDDNMTRWRVWDSCQLDGFMREASGHNPLGTENLRTRRRIHHKLAADPKRWGQITCMLCGRCDAVCPTGIGIKSVCKEIVDKYG